MKATKTQYARTLLELTDKKSEQEVSGVVKKFAEILKRNGQIGNARGIMEKFLELYNKKHGIVEAEIVTREKTENLEKIEKFIKEKYSAKEVILKNIVDKDIKGGVIMRIGDEVIDGSVNSQLKRLKKFLSN